MLYSSPELTKALLDDRERQIKEMRRVSAARKATAGTKKTRPGRNWLPIRSRNPQRA